MTEHTISVGAVQRTGLEGSGVPAYGWRCSCGSSSPPIVAVATRTGKVTAKARLEALEQARAGGLNHAKEAGRRP